MSYPVRAAEAVPRMGTSDQPTTASVRSFICLYSHDLRRKQKRWQDGKLRYHTFNRRIMVYDERGGFVGDAHWQEDHDFGDGEELQLDRGSAIVQVCEYTGEKQQDLTEILDKRAQEVEKRRANAAARAGITSQQGMRTPAPSARGLTPAVMTPTTGRYETSRPHFQPPHRSLSSIVPSPGPIGRAAIPEHSPYDTRKAEHGHGGSDGPASKRRRLSASPPSNGKSAFATRLFGAKLTLNGTAGAFAARNRVMRDATNMQASVGMVDHRDVQEKRRENENRNEPDVIMLDEAGIIPDVPPDKTAGTRLTDRAPPVTRRREPQYPQAPLHSRPSHSNAETEDGHQSKSQPLSQANRRAINNNHKAHQRDIEELSDDVEAPPEPSVAPRMAQNRRETVYNHKTNSREKTIQSSRPTGTDVADVSDTESKQQPPASKRAHPTMRNAMPRKRVDKEPEELPAEPQAEGPKELRTELRIKPRRKRGLLMVSEKNTTPATANERASKLRKDEPSVARQPQPESVDAAPDAEPVNVLERYSPDRNEVLQSPPPTAMHGSKANTSGQHDQAEAEKGDHVLATDSEKSGAEDAVSSAQPRPPETSTKRPKLTLDHEEAPQLRNHTVEISSEDDDVILQRSGRSRRTKKILTKDETDSEKSEAEPSNKHRADVSEGKRPGPRSTRLNKEREQQEPNMAEADGLVNRDIGDEVLPSVSQEESEEELPLQRGTRHGRHQKTSADRESLSEGPVVQKRTSRRATRQHRSYKEDFAFLSDESEVDPPQPAAKTESKKPIQREEPKETGPRIARMARKSVKSKEIFGFVLPENNLVPPAMAMAFGRVEPVIETEAMGPEPDVSGPTEDSEKQRSGQVNVAKTVIEQPRPTVPRIANPATRGKKAARKEDAAGLAPQVLVPLDPVMGATRKAAGPSARAAEKSLTGAMPGFSTASGGTWSKHAEDLLGMTRPGKPR